MSNALDQVLASFIADHINSLGSSKETPEQSAVAISNALDTIASLLGNLIGTIFERPEVSILRMQAIMCNAMGEAAAKRNLEAANDSDIEVQQAG